MFFILVKDLETRRKLLYHLNQAGITAVFHYVPLHKSPFAKKMGLNNRLPVTESIADRIIRLPFYNSLNQLEQDYIVQQVYKFFKIEYP